MLFRSWLVDEMNRRKWSQADLARRLGVTRQAVHHLISGYSQQPSIETLNKVAKAFDLPVDTVYQRAGILPAEADQPDEWTERMKRMLARVPPELRPTAEALLKSIADLEDIQRKRKR